MRRMFAESLVPPVHTGRVLIPTTTAQAVVLTAHRTVNNSCLASAYLMIAWALWNIVMSAEASIVVVVLFLALGAARVTSVYRQCDRARRILSFTSAFVWLWVAVSFWLGGVRTVVIPTVALFAIGDACRYWTLPRG